MLSFPQIRETIKRTLDDEMRSICLSLVDEIEKRAGKGGLWTYSAMSAWIGEQPGQPLVQDCIHFLATAPRARALAMHFLFFDPADPDDTGEIVTDAEARHAFASGQFSHPVSGEPIENFEDYIVPYFELSDAMQHGVRDG